MGLVTLNARILVGIAAVGLIIALVAASSLTQQPDDSTATQGVPASPLELELESITRISSDERNATFEIKFSATNPNPETVLLQYVQYGISTDDRRVHIGLIGARPEGFVIGSNYITILEGAIVGLDGQFSLRNTGSNPEFWEAITSDGVVWSVKAETSYNFSSFVAGGEHLVTSIFEDVPTIPPR